MNAPVGYWREMHPDHLPAPLVTAGLGAAPMMHGGRYYARQGKRAVFWSGLGDATSDYNAASAAYTQANNELSGAQSATDVQQAISDYLSSANSSLAVMNDAGNSGGATQVQAYVDTITTAQSSAANATDLATAQPNGTVAQAAASSALALAQTVAGSNKAQPGGTTTTGGGGGSGGGGGGGGGTPPTPVGQPTPTTLTTTGATNWWPWAIGAGAVVGAVAIAFALHHKKKGKK